MPVLIYILKMITCSAVLYVYYLLLLRNRCFHLYNRYFLLLILLLSTLVPLMRFPFFKSIPAALPVLENFSPGTFTEKELTITALENPDAINWPFLLLTVYSIISLFFCFRFCRSLFYLRKLKTRYPGTITGGIRLFFTNEPGTPFSFLNNIFWNNELDIDSKTGQQVLAHELYHVSEMHSLDMLFVESLIAIFWFNPFFIIIRKELKAIHEFLADKAATIVSEKQEYAELLVLRAIADKKGHLANSFFQNNIKRRIIMLTENNKTSFAYLRRVMCVPLLFLIFVACSRSVDNSLPEKSQQTFKNAADPEYPGGSGGWMRYLGKNFKYPKEAVEKEIQGTVVVQFVVDKEGNIHDVKALIGPEELKPEAVRLIKESGKWIPTKNNNQKVDAYRRQSITFRLQEEGSKGPILSKMEADAGYPGGRGSWMRYLNKNFNYPQQAVEKEIQGTVVVQFAVDKEGNIHDVKALSGPEELKPEAVRLIKESGKWIPTKNNNQEVDAYRRQPITFALQSE